MLDLTEIKLTVRYYLMIGNDKNISIAYTALNLFLLNSADLDGDKFP